MDKRKPTPWPTPLKVCRYGSMCFRLNPAHFDEYSHPHLEAILSAKNPVTGDYDSLPDNCPKEKVIEQLKILEGKQSANPPKAKIQKLDDEPTQKTSFLNPQTSSTQKSDLKPSLSSSKTSSPSTSSQKSPTSLKSKSVLQRKQEEKEFFKEQSQQFKESSPKSSSPTAEEVSKEQKLEAAMKQMLPVILPRGKMAEKLKLAAPYNMFLTTVTASPETHTDPLSITFQELLDSSLGEIESSVQINFMVDVGWLLAQYHFAKCSQQPLLILYGQEEDALRDINKKRPNITSIKVQIPTPYGCHHTKMMLFFYRDSSMRVIVSTANLYEDDWDNRVQGVWISEKLPTLSEEKSHTTHGESETSFRADLMRYLIAYNITKLQPMIARIRQTDFSSVNVFFVSSVPGSHRDSGKGIHYGHPRVATLLAQHSAPIDDANPIILQASSIGSLGSSASAYLTSEIASSFKRDSAPVGLRRVPQVKLIYPSLNNVLSSHDGMAGGGCLPYNSATHEKQQWLNEHLCQWRSTSRNRNQAMPHIKSYCRYSDRGLYWFILTSANLSRSAWGTLNKSNKTLNPTLRINSYEAGVVFFPRIIIEKDRFPLNEEQRKDKTPAFKLPFDLPPVPYGKLDVPYCAEYLKAYLVKYGVGSK